MASLTRPSIGPRVRSISTAAASTASASATSSGTAWARRPASTTSRSALRRPSSPRASRPTWAPAAVNARAVARPTPAEAPETTTTASSSFALTTAVYPGRCRQSRILSMRSSMVRVARRERLVLDQGDEAHRLEPGAPVTPLRAVNEHQPLLAIAHGDHQSSPDRELARQGGGRLLGGRGSHVDRIERRLFGESRGAVADHERDVVDPGRGEALRRPPRQLGVSLDAPHVTG